LFELLYLKGVGGLTSGKTRRITIMNFLDDSIIKISGNMLNSEGTIFLQLNLLTLCNQSYSPFYLNISSELVAATDHTSMR
jgi:hypothetical protein